MKHIFISLFTLFMLQLPLMAQDKQATYPDGLVRSTPEAEGVRSSGILNFIEAVEKNKIELHSFMLLRHGKVVAEGWWNPYRSDIRHIMYSVSKTYTATAIGLAVAENLLSLDDKVVSFFPEYEATYAANSYTKELTVKNLLTMSAGEEPYTDFRLRDTDWIQSFLGANLRSETANRFIYNSYATYMASAIVQRVTGKTMLDYLEPRLFAPLGITNIASEQSPAGITCGGWGMSLKTSDMAKLGQLYLQKGKWNGKQLLPESWVAEATKKQIDNSPNATEAERETSEWAQGYGYYLWRCRHNAFRADGAYGQLIVVMPDQDAVLAVTANANDMGKELQQVWDAILPAIADKKLPEDKKAHDTLKKKLATLALPEPINTAKVEPTNFSGTYSMENNGLGIESIALKQQGDLCHLTIRTRSATHHFTYSYNKWEHGTTDKNSPYYNATYRNPIGLSPFVVAGGYTWQDAQTMLLKLLYVEDGSSEVYRISFVDKRVVIFVSNTNEPEVFPTRLVGHLN